MNNWFLRDQRQHYEIFYKVEDIYQLIFERSKTKYYEILIKVQDIDQLIIERSKTKQFQPSKRKSNIN